MRAPAASAFADRAIARDQITGRVALPYRVAKHASHDVVRDSGIADPVQHHAGGAGVVLDDRVSLHDAPADVSDDVEPIAAIAAKSAPHHADTLGRAYHLHAD